MKEDETLEGAAPPSAPYCRRLEISGHGNEKRPLKRTRSHEVAVQATSFKPVAGEFHSPAVQWQGAASATRQVGEPRLHRAEGVAS